MKADRFLDTRVVFVMLAAASVAVYANGLQNGFVYDDNMLIVNNEYIEGWGRMFSHLTLYRPLRWISYSADYHVWGRNSLGYHITDLVLHIACTCLLYLFALQVLRNKPHAFIAGLLFAAHPVHTEVVDNISNRNDLFAAIFLLVVLMLYSRKGRSKFLYVLSVFSFLFVLLSKEAVAVTVPFLIVAYDIFFNRRSSMLQLLKTNARYYIPYFVLLGAFAVIALSTFEIPMRIAETTKDLGVKEGLSGASLTVEVGSCARSVVEYLRLLLLPVNLSAHYEFPSVRSLSEPVVLASLLVCIGFVACIVMTYRRWIVASFGVLWIVVTLVPVMNIVPVTPYFVAERYLYTPSIGFCLLAAFAIGSLYHGRLKRIPTVFQRRTALVCVTVVLAAYAVVTIERNRDWESDYTLWSKTLSRTPHSAAVHGYLGLGYQKEGQYDQAILEYRKALELSPNSALTYNNLGTALIESGRYDEALEVFTKAVDIDPDHPLAHYNLGSLLMWKKRYQEAAEEFRKAIETDPLHAGAYFSLGIIYVNGDSLDAGIAHLEKAVKLRPGDAKARYFLARAYQKKGRREDAKREYLRAVELDHRYANPPFGIEGPASEDEHTDEGKNSERE